MPMWPSLVILILRHDRLCRPYVVEIKARRYRNINNFNLFFQVLTRHEKGKGSNKQERENKNTDVKCRNILVVSFFIASGLKKFQT